MKDLHEINDEQGTYPTLDQINPEPYKKQEDEEENVKVKDKQSKPQQNSHPVQ